MKEISDEAIKPLILSKEDFERSFDLAPRVAINLIVQDEYGRVLLTRRAIPPQIDTWHMPGSFLLKNEEIEACQNRVASKELGIEIPPDQTLNLLGAFGDLTGDPRGHVIDLAYGLTVSGGFTPHTTDETSEVRFFERLPKNVGFNHRDTLHKLGFLDEE